MMEKKQTNFAEVSCIQYSQPSTRQFLAYSSVHIGLIHILVGTGTLVARQSAHFSGAKLPSNIY